MDVIRKAIHDICVFRINREILEYAYKPMTIGWRKSPLTVEEYITNSVIKARVIPDCNMRGGEEVLIPADNLQREVIDQFSALYYVPPSMTNNREIITVLSITFHSYNAGYTPSGYSPNLSGVSNAMVTPMLSLMASSDITSLFSSASTEVIDGNTILVRNSNGYSNMGFFRCLVSNASDMGNIGITAIPYFVELCTLAVKSHIYLTTRIKLDMGKLEGGHELGAIREEIEKFADAEQMYQDLLKQKWGKVVRVNNAVSMERLMRLMIGSGIA